MPGSACVDSNLLSGCKILVADWAGEPQRLFVSMITNLTFFVLKEFHINNSTDSMIRKQMQSFQSDCSQGWMLEVSTFRELGNADTLESSRRKLNEGHWTE
jgi:hypothetical protein